MEIRKAPHEPLTVGELLSLLSQIGDTADVHFDFGGFVPTSIDSYRGYYSELALGYDSQKYHSNKITPDPTVRDVVRLLENSLGQTFTGYKGGDYIMTKDTRVYVANYSECHGTGVVGVQWTGNYPGGDPRPVTLMTANCEDY